MTTFKYDKDMIMIEFKEAKSKDLKSKKKKSYKHRIAFCQGHLDLYKEQPKVYSNVDINWENLLEMWSAPDPRDHCYRKVFGMSYAEVQKKSRELDAEDLVQ